MSNDNLFGNFVQDLETSVKDVPEYEKLDEADAERVERWKAKRIGKITSSNLPDLMKLDKSGHCSQKKGIDYLLEVMHQRQTGIDAQESFAKAFEWGHLYEGEALDYYNKVTNSKVISGTYGFNEILFREPLYGFGDSPDGVTPDGKGGVEIKNPYNAANHLRNCALTAYHDKLDYFWQMIGHMIDERVEWFDFVSYDPRYDDGHPNKIKILRINKEDVKARIDQAVNKIGWWNELIDNGDITKIIEEA